MNDTKLTITQGDEKAYNLTFSTAGVAQDITGATVKMTISVPATSATTMPIALTFGQVGKRFATGIGIACTAAATATDVGVSVVGIQINATYI